MNRVQLLIELKKMPESEHKAYLQSLGLTAEQAEDWLMDYAKRPVITPREERAPFTQSPAFQDIQKRAEWLKSTGEKLHGDLDREPPRKALPRKGNIAADLQDLRQRIDPTGYD